MQAKFTGIQLIEVSRDALQIGFLEGDFGREFLVEYNGRVKRDYADNNHLKVLTESNDLVTGSNPFAVVLANEILREEGLRTAAQADLEQALRLEALDLKETYEDTGLFLRSEDEPNQYLASDLAKQLRARNSSLEYPLVFSLKDLELRIDSSSPKKLAFTLKEGASPIYVPILKRYGTFRFDSSDVDEATGLPITVRESGERIFCKMDRGLYDFGLTGEKYTGTSRTQIENSNDEGRIVIVKI